VVGQQTLDLFAEVRILHPQPDTVKSSQYSKSQIKYTSKLWKRIMKPVLVCAVQPTVDRTIVVPNFIKGQTYRLSEVTALPSGKALNVARALRDLGTPVVVIALFGGHSGRWIREQLEKMDIQVFGIEMDGENRLAYAVYDPVNNQSTEFIEETDGPVTGSVWHRYLDCVKTMMKDASGVIISGKGPNGLPSTAYRDILDIAHSHKVNSFVDCYGPLLKNVIESRPLLVKINRAEAGGLLSRDLITVDDCIKAGMQINAAGINNVVITLGAEGAVYVSRKGIWVAKAPEMIGSAVGSGDAMMAGLIHTFSGEFLDERALRFSVSMGAANVAVLGACMFKIDDVNRLVNQIDITYYPLVCS
jgi:1-phosphofructokinase family hexose kinase